MNNAAFETHSESKRNSRWIITPSMLYLLEQVFNIERFPSLHMRQRLAADLQVSARQVSARFRASQPHKCPRIPQSALSFVPP